MEITMTARGVNVPDSIRRHTEVKLRRIERFEKRPLHSEVYFLADGLTRTVEVKLGIGGSSHHVAQGSGSNYRSAVDQAVDRLVRQLKRNHERRVSRKKAYRPESRAS